MSLSSYEMYYRLRMPNAVRNAVYYNAENDTFITDSQLYADFCADSVLRSEYDDAFGLYRSACMTDNKGVLREICVDIDDAEKIAADILRTVPLSCSAAELGANLFFCGKSVENMIVAYANKAYDAEDYDTYDACQELLNAVCIYIGARSALDKSYIK